MQPEINPAHGPSAAGVSGTLFVSDLDGTLLPSSKKVPAGQVATLNRLIDRGLQFTVATARSIQAVNALLGDVHLQLPAITLGGSLVTRPDSRDHLIARTLPGKTSAEVMSLLSHRGVLPFVAAIDERRDWAFHSHAASAVAQWYVDEKIASGDPRLRWYDQPTDVLHAKILTFTIFVEQEDFAGFANELAQLEGVRVSSLPVRHFPGWHEVTVSHPKADKGQALEALKQLWSGKWERVIAFGDDINDLALFEAANRAVAVGNAAPEVLAKADEVIGSNDSGAVIGYLARYASAQAKDRS